MGDNSIQLEARALGDPTRYRLFRYIAEVDHPVGVAELTAFVHLNHNAVRQHLSVLKAAGLIVDELEVRHSAGRPRLLYRLHHEAAGRWETSGSYAWLAGQMGVALSSGLGPREVGRLAGRQRWLDTADGGDPVARIEVELSRGGFRPTRREAGQRVEFILGRCPFAEVAADNPATVCQLHLGFAEGLAEGAGNVTVDRLTAKNPLRADCRLVLRRSAPEP